MKNVAYLLLMLAFLLLMGFAYYLFYFLINVKLPLEGKIGIVIFGLILLSPILWRLTQFIKDFKK